VKTSVKAKRHERHYQRMHKVGGLNLVSLMDIFTILVFFLMVNSSDVQVLHQNSTIKLPTSVATQKPKNTLVITVTASSILVQGRKVVEIKDIIPGQETISGLKKELDYQYRRTEVKNTSGKINGLPITIMGDKNMPYNILKKIMATSVAAHYTKISLAVTHKIGKEA